MFAVFAAFVPEGEGPIKTIAFGLAVGVFVDAFVVRMTLVPAVLALLGRSAWWLPRWIDRRLPSFDVEGEGLAHQLALADWPAPDDDHCVYAEDLRLAAPRRSRWSPCARRDRGRRGPAGAGKPALLLTLAGRMRLAGGRVKVAGLVLPEQAAAVRRRTAYRGLREHSTDPRAEFRAVQRAGARGHLRRPRRPADRRRRPGRAGQPARRDRRRRHRRPRRGAGRPRPGDRGRPDPDPLLLSQSVSAARPALDRTA